MIIHAQDNGIVVKFELRRKARLFSSRPHLIGSVLQSNRLLKKVVLWGKRLSNYLRDSPSTHHMRRVPDF